ncbi:MAG: nucleotidyl transferase AbiEii/AbiGii toxin family protein [Parvularculales bacterium]
MSHPDMIRPEQIEEWAEKTPWTDPRQVEQDMVVSRAVADIFSHPEIQDRIYFIGGTALNKIHMDKPSRFSEDIDLIQVRDKDLAPTIDAIRFGLDPWLNKPVREGQERGKSKSYIYKLYYRLPSQENPKKPVQLKIEINTRDHDHVFGLEKKPYEMSSSWHSGNAIVPIPNVHELIGRKMNALYERSRGRDLFDIGHAIREGIADPEWVIEALNKLRENRGAEPLSREDFEARLRSRVDNVAFKADMDDLMPDDQKQDIAADTALVIHHLVERLPT